MYTPSIATNFGINMNGFINYVLSFYGNGGIYAMGATREQVEKATDYYLSKCVINGFDFCGDTVDREAVRDVMITQFGLIHASTSRSTVV